MSLNGSHTSDPSDVERPVLPGRPVSSLRRWITAGLACVGILFWLKSYVGFVLVDGDSMLPTFHSRDLLLISKRSYRAHPPARGDIVVSKFRTELIVKRVIGLPGETVEVVDGGVRVNGAPIPETHAMKHGTLSVRPGELFPDRIAVLGDNRSGDDYQLFYAVVPHQAVVGKAVLAFRLAWSDFRFWRT